jgi:hypothetical protein
MKTNRQRSTIQSSKEKQSDKGRQYNGLKENKQRSTIQWSKEKQTHKGRQYNGLRENKQTKIDNTMV